MPDTFRGPPTAAAPRSRRGGPSYDPPALPGLRHAPMVCTNHSHQQTNLTAHEKPRLGVPSARAACGGNESLPWLPLTVVHVITLRAKASCASDPSRRSYHLSPALGKGRVPEADPLSTALAST